MRSVSGGVTIGVPVLAEVEQRIDRAFQGEQQGSRISFISYELMHKVLTPLRWDILRAMAGQGPMTIRAIADQVARDVHAVHRDVKALQLAGVLDKAENGQAVFPYDSVHLDVTLKAT